MNDRRKGFTLAELLVAMGITAIILTLLVSVTGVALDGWRISRNKVRASRQAKAALDQLSRDFESMVVRSGNEFEWLFAESEADEVHQVEGAELLHDDDPPIALSRPLSVGRIVDPVTRTTEVRFAFDNVSARLPIGQSVELRLFVGGEVSETAVPRSAIVDDGGRPVVFVQTGGESFERRPVRLGSRAGDWVHVLEGIEAGERVVHRGAYLVRLAAMSTQIPAHGHVH